MSKGIDYGMGQTNIDKDTGIRFGVISSGEVCQAWSDSSEAEYGDAHCPKCGNEAASSDADFSDDDFCTSCQQHHIDIDKPCADDNVRYDRDDYEEYHHGRDFACDSCRIKFDGEYAFGEEPIAWTLNDGEYKATQSGSDHDIFILSSPYYTRAAYCSPCAPGACYLMSPTDDGDKAYCFGHDWFDEGKAPYPVYRVADDTLVSPEDK